jgi:hypothetical protein
MISPAILAGGVRRHLGQAFFLDADFFFGGHVYFAQRYRSAALTASKD